MNFNRFDFFGWQRNCRFLMFAKCEMQLANFQGRGTSRKRNSTSVTCGKADFRDAAGYKVDILLGSRLKDAKFSLPEAVNLLADLKIKLSCKKEKISVNSSLHESICRCLR